MCVALALSARSLRASFWHLCQSVQHNCLIVHSSCILQLCSAGLYYELSYFGLCFNLESISRSVMSDSCGPMDCRPPGPSVHGILQARILEWVAMPSSRGSSWPRDQTLVCCIVGRRPAEQRERGISHIPPLSSSISSVQSLPSQFSGEGASTLGIVDRVLCHPDTSSGVKYFSPTTANAQQSVFKSCLKRSPLPEGTALPRTVCIQRLASYSGMPLPP